jgi:hypothetical protein
LSALSFNCLPVILDLALVALTAGGAHAAQSSAPAKMHCKTTAAAGAQARTATQNN